MANNKNLAQLQLTIDKVTAPYVLSMIRSGSKPIFWGPVGIGKTDIAAELANHLTKEARATDANHPGYELRAIITSHLPPEDISGLQIVDRDTRSSYSTRPAFMGDKNKRYVLLLDEYNRAPQSYRNTLLQFILSGKVGEHEVHPDTIVLLAANASGDDVVGLQRLGYADRNRIIHINLTTSTEIWLKWAQKNDINPTVIAFLGSNEDKLQTKPTDASNEGFATPRSWAAVARMMDSPYFVTERDGKYTINEAHREQLQVAVNGTIGAVSAEFFAYLDTMMNLPSPKEILEKCYFPKDDFGLQYGAMASVVGYLSKHTVLKDKGGDEKNDKIVPTNFNNDTWVQFCKLIEEMRKQGRNELRTCAVRLIFRGLGFLYPNRPQTEQNPTVLESYIGTGKTQAEREASKSYKMFRDLLDEFLEYFR